MKIHYQDEYGEAVFTGETDVVPRVGEMVIFADEDYRVKSVTWVIQHSAVVVEITQNLVKIQEEDKTEGRLREVKNAIVSLAERMESTERRGRILTDQVVRIKTNIRTQERKNKNDTR